MSGTAPANLSLLPQQFFWDLGAPGKIYVGVPTSVDATGRKMILDLAATGVGGGGGGVTSWNTRTGAVALTSADVTTALTFTPYSNANPAGYQTAANVTTTLGPYALTASVNAKLAGKITVSSTAPGSPAVNDIWVDTT